MYTEKETYLFNLGVWQLVRQDQPMTIHALQNPSFFRQGYRPVFGRTHAFAPFHLPRTIHKLDSANNAKSWAVFFFNPR